jgi:hypothetical protein
MNGRQNKTARAEIKSLLLDMGVFVRQPCTDDENRQCNSHYLYYNFYCPFK